MSICIDDARKISRDKVREILETPLEQLERDIAPLIDHTLLRAEAGTKDIEKLCEEALRHSFKAVCVNGVFVDMARDMLKGSNVKVCAVAAFPLGATLTQAKVREIELLVEEGAQEIDFVIPIGRLKDGYYDYVYRELGLLKRAAGDRTVKAIIEACLLTDDEKAHIVELIAKAEIEFVKTSTGFSSAGATYEDVALLRALAPKNVLVKASGGIKTREQALRLAALGADRIGTSKGSEIV